MSSTLLRLLLLKDNESDAQLVRTAIEQHAAGEFAITWVKRLADALAQIRAEHFDVMLADVDLPDSTGLATVQAIFAHPPAPPLVVLTGMSDENLGREAIRYGAQTYFLKAEAGESLIARALHYYAIGNKLANETALMNETRLRVALSNIDMAVFHQDRALRYTWMYNSQLGYTPEQVLGRTDADLLPPEAARQVTELKQRVLNKGEIVHDEVCVATKDGTFFYELTAEPLREASDAIIGLTGVTLDITERKSVEKALRESELLFREFAENTPDIFWIRDAESTRMIYVSPGWETITGHPLPRTRQAFLDVVHPDDMERVSHDMQKLPRGGIDHEYRIVHRDGSVRWLRVQTFPVRDREGKLYRIAGISEDVTDRKDSEQRLLRLAHYDSLTNLPNRTLFYESLERNLELARQNHWIVGLLFIDLDRFKGVNDTLGHAIGDELLEQVASRLLRCVRLRDIVGRLGGDEFALIAPGLDRADEAATVAAKVIESLSHSFAMGGQEIFITASVGITVFPADAADAAMLLRYADTAMYRAKEEGRNTYRFYTSEMNVRAVERLKLENSLRHAVEREEFLLHYQPKLNLKTGVVSGWEALLRWQRPGVGLVSPAEFIPLLEDTGLIVPVGEWVVGEAFQQMWNWREAGLGSVRMAINLSARQFFEKDLNSKIVRAAEQFGLDHELIELEITESSLMSHAEETISILHKMKAAGFRLTVDDFGTGYSSLSYLKRFPIDTLKIDRSFVRDIPGDPDDTGIVRAILSMAHTLRLAVVAEGVETAEQFEFLRSLGCDEAQGYYFARPMDSEAVTKLLREPS